MLLSGESLPLSAIPSLSSRPGAPATLYLDFTGDSTDSWNQAAPGITPAYDTDDDPSTFWSDEIDSIRYIYQQVADRFSPVNLNVTTVPPTALIHKKSFEIVIGGNGEWLSDDGSEGGIALVGSFAKMSMPNKAFVFSNNLENDDDIADAIAHEAGHAFGLNHQSVYEKKTLLEDYNPGDSDTGVAPLMGVSYGAIYRQWWRGSSTSARRIQDDLAIIASRANGFGYAKDDFGNNSSRATLLTPDDSGGVSVNGIVERATDSDWFTFIGGGSVTVSVDSAGMIQPDATLYRGNKKIGKITDVDGTVTFDHLKHGKYFIRVSGQRGYGNVGGYSLHAFSAGDVIGGVSVTPSADDPTGSLTIRWQDPSGGQTPFDIERSSDGVNFTLFNTFGVDAHETVDSGLVAGTTYIYRVTGTNADESTFTEIGQGTTAPGIRLIPIAITALEINRNLMKVIDLNGDGIQDLMDDSGNVFLGSKDGTFSTAIANPVFKFFNGSAFADVNADGRPDLINRVGWDLWIYLNNGDGTFAVPIQVALGPSRNVFGTQAIIVADFTGDGIPDVIDPLGGELLTSLTIAGFPSDGVPLPADVHDAANFIVADFNGDGIADLAASIDLNHLTILLGNSSGALQAVPVTLPAAAQYNNLNVSDFNGDGRADMAIHYGSVVQLMISNGDGTFAAQDSFEVNTGDGLYAGDFDGDHRPDLFMGFDPNGSSGNVAFVLRNEGEGSFAQAQAIGTHVQNSYDIDGFVVSDFDNNGLADVVVLQPGINTLLLNETGKSD